MLFRSTAGLAENTANNGLKEVLRTAQISQHRNRVEADANLPQSLPIDLLNAAGNIPDAPPAAENPSGNLK